MTSYPSHPPTWPPSSLRQRSFILRASCVPVVLALPSSGSLRLRRLVSGAAAAAAAAREAAGRGRPCSVSMSGPALVFVRCPWMSCIWQEWSMHSCMGDRWAVLQSLPETLNLVATALCQGAHGLFVSERNRLAGPYRSGDVPRDGCSQFTVKEESPA
ncbi:hypothetical protein PYCCODRAFT_1236818 [Trametes coccinea BRFM310]|uniref:Uncharacterized protein n=1 Tax=Trametes coccinea (strain BRFM310) TaxID=1353009 RepID=A0A1Y2IW99_TRAC3|nr:hypothetical protein PYCCODRAFT_1236818 [Trametes coccinea BRFM310]